MSLCEVYTIRVFKKASASATSRKACRWPVTAEPNNAMPLETVSFLVLPTIILCRYLIIPVRAKCPAQLLLIHLIAAKKGEAPNYTTLSNPLSLVPTQHQFRHNLDQSEVIGSRGGDHKITIFRYMTECLPLIQETKLRG